MGLHTQTYVNLRLMSRLALAYVNLQLMSRLVLAYLHWQIFLGLPHLL